MASSPPRRFASDVAHTGAWIFIAFSLSCLAWAVFSGPGGIDGPVAIFESTVAMNGGELTQRPWGLAYDGLAGTGLALAQGVLVAAAAIFSLRRRWLPRAGGHVLLVGWATLWTLGLIGLAAFDRGPESLLQAAAMFGFLGCTVYRAAAGIGPRRSVAADPTVETHHLVDTLTDPVPASAPTPRWRRVARRLTSWIPRRRSDVAAAAASVGRGVRPAIGRGAAAVRRGAQCAGRVVGRGVRGADRWCASRGMTPTDS